VDSINSPTTIFDIRQKSLNDRKIKVVAEAAIGKSHEMWLLRRRLINRTKHGC